MHFSLEQIQSIKDRYIRDACVSIHELNQKSEQVNSLCTRYLSFKNQDIDYNATIASLDILRSQSFKCMLDFTDALYSADSSNTKKSKDIQRPLIYQNLDRGHPQLYYQLIAMLEGNRNTDFIYQKLIYALLTKLEDKNKEFENLKSDFSQLVDDIAKHEIIEDVVTSDISTQTNHDINNNDMKHNNIAELLPRSINKNILVDKFTQIENRESLPTESKYIPSMLNFFNKVNTQNLLAITTTALTFILTTVFYLSFKLGKKE